jgi:transposase-like protein
MGKQYALEFKESIIKRMVLPHNEYIPDLSRETGIPVDTLYGWRVKYRSRSLREALSNTREKSSLTSEEKLSAILETMAFNETERGEYCRRKGLYPEQIAEWKNAVLEGLASPSERGQRGTVSQQAKTIRQLESELLRKEKALAEAATLLMLKKKVDALLEGKEVGRSMGTPGRR